MYRYKLLTLVISQIFLTSFSWIYSQYIFKITFKEIEVSLLARDGFIGLWKPSEIEYLFFLVLNAVAVIGLLFHLKFFRVFYVFVLIIIYGSLPLLGYSVLPPMGNFFTALITLIDGMLLMFIFSEESKVSN